VREEFVFPPPDLNPILSRRSIRACGIFKDSITVPKIWHPEFMKQPPTTLSPEGKIASGLAKLGCGVHHFAEIVPILSRSRIKSALLDSTKRFKTADANRLLDLLDRMVKLQDSILVAIDWSKTEKVRTALAVRLAASILQEQGNHELDSAAGAATRAVTTEPLKPSSVLIVSPETSKVSATLQPVAD
jgi:hypothetical protein